MEKKRENFITIAAIAVVVIGVALYAYFIVMRNNDPNTISEAAVAFATTEDVSPYTDLGGNPVQLSDYIGQVIVVNSWASWSPLSATELPLIDSVVSNYGDEVVFLAINRAEPATTAQQFLNTFNVSGHVQLILDVEDRYYESIRGFSMPETVYYDQEGNIITHVRGPSTKESVEANIAKALNQ